MQYIYVMHVLPDGLDETTLFMYGIPKDVQLNFRSFSQVCGYMFMLTSELGGEM